MILTLNNTDTSFPRRGNGLIGFERSAWLAGSPGLWAGLSLGFVSFSNSGEGGAGRSGWVLCFGFFSSLTSLRCFELPSYRRHTTLEEEFLPGEAE